MRKIINVLGFITRWYIFPMVLLLNINYGNQTRMSMINLASGYVYDFLRDYGLISISQFSYWLARMVVFIPAFIAGSLPGGFDIVGEAISKAFVSQLILIPILLIVLVIAAPDLSFFSRRMDKGSIEKKRRIPFSFAFVVFLTATIIGHNLITGIDTFYNGDYTGQLSAAGVTVPVEVNMLGHSTDKEEAVTVTVRPNTLHKDYKTINKRFDANGFLCFFVLKTREGNSFFRTSNGYAGFTGNSDNSNVPCQSMSLRINAENKAVMTMKGGITLSLTRVPNPDRMLNKHRNSLIDNALNDREFKRLQ